MGNYDGFLRSTEKIVGERLKNANYMLPDGIPVGPWETIEVMKRELDTWSQSLEFGGSFRLNIKDFNEGIKSRGPQMRYCCAHHRFYKGKGSGKRKRSSIKTGCKFGIKCELSSEGWILVKMSDESHRELSPFKPHNHPLKQLIDNTFTQTTADERMKMAKREIDLQALCIPMCQVASENEEDYEFLKKEFQKVRIALGKRQTIREKGKYDNEDVTNNRSNELMCSVDV